ncbi:MAG TPA: enoyl-CoA hydratase/isomerase family protein [Burkholderiales bacterium]|nr:enoyl-CoA hydratase/isomerase family protein [Burkholderiales bacterium]
MPLVEYRQEESIAYITLNRPEKLNAFSDEVGVAFCDALYRFNDDAEARVGIISGNGRAFCSGADVRQRQMRAREEMEKLGSPAGRGANFREPFFRSANAKPIVAAVHGYVYGLGVRIALYADLLVAARDARFQITETPRGLDSTPFWMMIANQGAGAFATEVALTGRTWTAEEAAAHGMLTRLCEPGEHVKIAQELARKILENPPLAVRAVVAARRSMLHEIDVKAHAVGPRGLHLTEDFRESAAAFLEKRKPVYHGR